jgi:hypothetical protein
VREDRACPLGARTGQRWQGPTTCRRILDVPPWWGMALELAECIRTGSVSPAEVEADAWALAQVAGARYAEAVRARAEAEAKRRQQREAMA